MALQLERISLPCGPGSLAQLTQSATHVLRIDHSGPSLLIDVSGKKPFAHELPMNIEVKSFADAAAAKKELDALIASKMKKGYREV